MIRDQNDLMGQKPLLGSLRDLDLLLTNLRALNDRGVRVSTERPRHHNNPELPEVKSRDFCLHYQAVNRRGNWNRFSLPLLAFPLECGILCFRR